MLIKKDCSTLFIASHIPLWYFAPLHLTWRQFTSPFFHLKSDHLAVISQQIKSSLVVESCIVTSLVESPVWPYPCVMVSFFFNSYWTSLAMREHFLVKHSYFYQQAFWYVASLLEKIKFVWRPGNNWVAAPSSASRCRFPQVVLLLGRRSKNH